MDLLTQAYEERQGRRGEGGVNTFMHWHFTSACLRQILLCNALGTTLIVAEANFSYPVCGAIEFFLHKNQCHCQCQYIRLYSRMAEL